MQNAYGMDIWESMLQCTSEPNYINFMGIINILGLFELLGLILFKKKDFYLISISIK